MISDSTEKQKPLGFLAEESVLKMTVSGVVIEMSV